MATIPRDRRPEDLAAEARADRAARRLAAIVESSDDAIVSKDLNGIVTSWNNAAERMFGYTAAEMIGESIRTIIPADRQQEEDEVLARIRRGDKVDHFETMRQCKDGSLLPVSLTVSPIRDAGGTIVGASKIARDISERKRAEAERTRLLAIVAENAAITERLNEVGAVVASALDQNDIVQAVVDAATKGTHAEFGAFFYNVYDEQGERSTLYSISGVPREAFSSVTMPRNTEVLRSDDITADPRYRDHPPYLGMPAGNVPVRSYLAVPVKTRAGDVVGGLFFGHSDPGTFSDRHERLVIGIAAWASVALDNARLYAGVQEASRLKDEFLATLSHELRTPLNAILGYARMIKSGIVGGDKQLKALDTIERNATSLTQIVEDVLDVSRIISGKMRLNVQKVDLADVVRHAIEGVVPAADAKAIRIETEFDPEAEVSGDPERLQQVVWNLMSNAVKFTGRGGRVHVRVTHTDTQAEVLVTDTGIGIKPEFLPHIFERFRQADAGMTRERGGLGLGLAITRQLIELHGGAVDVSSAGEGTGATFRVRLPLMVPQPARQPEVTTPHVARTHASIAVPDLRGVRVLAVDDDRDALTMVREILEVTGADIVVADSAQDALDLLQDARPDVIVADLGMPRMDGFALITQVRNHANPALRDIPAAALTAYARSEDRATALRKGFQLHLAKPIDPAELMASVAALAKRRV